MLRHPPSLEGAEPASNFKNKNPAVIVLRRNRFPTAPKPEDGESEELPALEPEPDDEVQALTDQQPLREEHQKTGPIDRDSPTVTHSLAQKAATTSHRGS